MQKISPTYSFVWWRFDTSLFVLQRIYSFQVETEAITINMFRFFLFNLFSFAIKCKLHFKIINCFYIFSLFFLYSFSLFVFGCCFFLVPSLGGPNLWTLKPTCAIHIHKYRTNYWTLTHDASAAPISHNFTRHRSSLVDHNSDVRISMMSGCPCRITLCHRRQ